MQHIDEGHGVGDTVAPGPVPATAVDPDGAADPPIEPGARAALITFVVALVLSGLLVLVELGNQRWFIQDEWEFLESRHLTDLGDLFRPHNEHWTTLPIVAYRLVWNSFGLRSYLPYQALVVVTHLGAVALLRVVMRRAGVGPWIATAAAASLLLFGSGKANIVWGFQISFVGAFAFGLVHLLLADHDGGLDRRDWLGLLAGVAALMFSGIGITMAVVVGVAVLIRRTWWAALFHTVPLAVAYGAWWLAERPLSGQNPDGSTVTHIAGQIATFVGKGITAGFGGLGYFTIVGFALAAMLVVGLTLAWGGAGWSGFRATGSSIAALLVGVVAFLALSGYGRWYFGTDYAGESRYVYLSAAMLLPALAVAAEALMRRWRVLTPVVLVVLLVGVPFNVKRFTEDDRHTGPSFDVAEQMVVAVANSPLADQVPDWVEIDPRPNPGLTIGWLREVRDDGGLPPAEPVDEATANLIPVRLGVAQSFAPPVGTCQTLTGKLDLRPEKGAFYGFSGGLIAVAPLDDAGEATAPPLKFAPNHGRRLNILLDDLHIQIKPGALDEPIRFCQ